MLLFGMDKTPSIPVSLPPLMSVSEARSKLRHSRQDQRLAGARRSRSSGAVADAASVGTARTSVAASGEDGGGGGGVVEEDEEPPLLVPAHRTSTYDGPQEQEVETAELSPRDAHAGQFRLQLWQFLLLLLSRPEDFGNTIKWTDDSGEFKVFDTEELARLWGGRKGRNTMNYDKLSRSLRYYYDKGILKKVTGQRLVYRFDAEIHRRHVQQLQQGLSGVVSLQSSRNPATAAAAAAGGTYGVNSGAAGGQRSDSPSSQHTSDAVLINAVKREQQERAEGGGGGGGGRHGHSAKRARKEKSGIEEHQASSMEASLLFGRALREGCMVMPRCRMFLIGPRRSGKTSLKRLLLGIAPDVTLEESALDGVDADADAAVFHTSSPYHMDSTCRSALPWKTEDVRHSRLREFDRRVSRWVSADLMSFSHEAVQQRMPASQQIMLHNERSQFMPMKLAGMPAGMAGMAHAYTGVATGPTVSATGTTASSYPAPVTPSRTPPGARHSASPSVATAVSTAGFTTASSSSTSQPASTLAPGPSSSRFVPTASNSGAAVVAAPGAPTMMWPSTGAAPGVINRPTTLIQPVYMPTLAPGPFFMSAATQPPPRFFVPMNAAGTPDMAHAATAAAAGYPAAAAMQPPTTTYAPATGPFPDLPEELVSRVASYLRQARGKGVEFFTDAQPAFPGLVHIWDLPGDTVHHAVLSSLMVRHAIYVLTLDLSLDLNSPMPAEDGSGAPMDGDAAEAVSGASDKSYLELIIDSLDFVRACTSHHQDSASVQRLVPAVVIVGTHLDLLGPPDSDQAKRRARERFAMVKRALQGRLSRKYITFPFFAVDCLLAGQENDHADLLRCHIEDVTQTYFPTSWPYAYLRFEQIIEAERRRGLVCLPLADVMKMAKVHCLLEQQATFTMLAHMHNLGLVIYTPRIARMDDLVVIRPQWLLGAVNRLICTPPTECATPALASSWHHLATEGVLEEELICEAWQDYGANQSLLLDMMQRMDLICPSLPHVIDRCIENSSMTAEEEEEIPQLESSVYYLPSMVQFGPSYEEFLHALSPERVSATLMIVFADNFLPGSIFPHLLQRCLLLCPMRPHIFKQCARLAVDADHDLLLLANKETLQVVVESTDYSSAASPPHSDVCAEVLRFIVTCLNEFASQYEHGIDFEVCVECTCSAPTPSKPPASCVYLDCSPDEQHYAKLPLTRIVSPSAHMPLGTSHANSSSSQAAGNGPFEWITCARGTDIAVPLNVQVWIEPGCHRSDSQSVSECLHYNIRLRLSQLLDPHLGGRAALMLGALLGFSPHEINRLEQSDSLTMSLIETWESRPSSSVSHLREKVALLRCEDAIDLLDSI
ncbi:uncharacterized protein LOC135805927 [Sycon ciliatum]|uniref:uncharacterized protein LOC135805927 n=1 Tax=Sycon ciliatum TaxID=27933 RepID=UPI0031F68DF2